MANEKRLISVDEWDTFFAEHIYNRCFRNEYEQGYTDALDRVDDWMDEHPTVDAVEVVRCKDCKHWKKDALACDTLPWANSYEHANWYAEDFCSFGERRTDE